MKLARTTVLSILGSSRYLQSFAGLSYILALTSPFQVLDVTLPSFCSLTLGMYVVGTGLGFLPYVSITPRIVARIPDSRAAVHTDPLVMPALGPLPIWVLARPEALSDSSTPRTGYRQALSCSCCLHQCSSFCTRCSFSFLS